jgi:PAS domain S-box-containing protein
LSRKRAKSQTRGDKLRLTGAKAPGARARKTRADLERQLKACRRQIAQARERLAEAAVQQTATSEMLRLISNSPIQLVLDAVAEHAARLCDASNARIWRLEDNLLRLVASYGESAATMDGREGLPVDRDTVTGRAAYDRRTFHVHDISAEDSEYPVGSRLVKGQGWHTTLATPLLREGTPIGTILVRRTEVRPFDDRQIALLETFAGQAAIAIENVRLFEAEKKRTLALARSEMHLAQAQRLSQTGSYSWKPGTNERHWSDEIYRIFDIDPAQEPDIEKAFQRVHPDQRDHIRRVVELHASGEGSTDEIIRLLFPDGSVKFVHLTSHALRGNSGEIEIVGAVSDITKVKVAEEALRESEYKLRQIIETVPGLIWSNGPNGEPTHISQRMLDYSGMRFEDFKHRGWEAFVHPADFPGTTNAFYQAIQTGTLYQGVMRLRRSDGEFRWHHARCEPLRDRQGNIIQWYGLSIDIDEAKKTEEQPRSAVQLQATLNVIPAYTWYTAPSGELTFVNKRTADYLGLPEDHPLRLGIDIGAPWDAHIPLLHPDDREGSRKAWATCLSAGQAAEFSFRVPNAHGDYRWFISRAEPLRASDGTLLQWVGVNLDIEELKFAEQALRESEAKFRDYAETASDWFWEMGPDYKFTLLTENAFGSDPAARIGTACWDHALDLESEPEKWRHVRATLDARKPFRDFVYCSKDRNGSPMYVRASGTPVFDTSGEFRGYRGTGTDVTAITRARQVEESLRTVQAELTHVGRVATLGQLTASIAHEVTQPIGSARNNARAALNFLDRESPNLGEVKEALECVVADADRAGHIVGRIRDHIKKAPPRRERFDLNEAINEVLLLARTTITENEVSVRTRFAERPLAAYGDRVQLQQVVLNLILNAVEAMASVKVGVRQLLISTEQNRADEVLVAIRDSGPGIEPDRLERVFEAFYTTKSNGVGMGLAICRSIISAEGGKLWAEANKPRGAVFRFTLPNAEKS